jgi:outer membrane protein OmpA-like peptidoglycan-associated protein
MRRFHPWPAVADLFSGLLIVCFAALVAFSLFASRKLKEQDARVRIDKRQRLVEQVLTRSLKGARPESCDLEDVCVSVQIQYGLNSNEVTSAYQSDLQGACQGLKRAFESWSTKERSEIYIQIEGHTDPQQPEGLAGRQKYLYNWTLSSGRAASVLYELDRCDLSTTGIKMIAVGLADTRPVCSEPTEDCYQRNRRTTFRIRPDHHVLRGNSESK